MTQVRLTFALVALSALTVATLGVRGQAGSDDLKAMQGTWSVKIVEVDGAPAGDVLGKLMLVLTVKGDTFRVLNGKQVLSVGKLTLDASKQPATIDALTTEGPNKDKLQKGVYKLNGDKMTVVFGQFDKDRPKEFKTTENTGQSMLHYERLKAMP